MRQPILSFRALVALTLLLSAAQAALAAAPAPSAPDVDQARRLYDEGRYQEAGAILAALDSAGQLGGADLYRLFYTRQVSADPQAQAALTRAIAALEAESPAARGLEGAFYLANAYESGGRGADARRVAQETTARLESKDLPAPTRGVDMFRAAKLYADQGQAAKAADWYERALAAFAGTGEAAGGYASWAHGYLARQAFDARTYAKAAEHWAGVDVAKLSLVELDQFAVSRARSGDFRGAADVWRKALLRDPANGDRARYAAQIAVVAAEIGELPLADATGRRIGELGKEDLEALMSGQAILARDVLAEAAAEMQSSSLDPAAQEAIQARVTEARRIFVAASLEYTLDGHPIRDTAFIGGYAPMIFQPQAWKLQEPVTDDPPSPPASGS